MQPVLYALAAIAILGPAVRAHPFGLAPYWDTIELVWIQDFSASYEDDLPNLKQQLPDVFEELKWTFPHSHVAIAGFTDKPVEPFGSPVSKDYCYQLKYRLTRYTSRVVEALDLAQIHSGRDWKESQLQAILSAALQRETNWFPNRTTPNGYNIHRLIVLATDSGFHEAGDADGLQPNRGDGTFSASCTEEDYPSVTQVKAALEQQHIIPIFLVTEDVVPIYRRLVRDIGPRGVVWPVARDSHNVKDALFNSISLILNNDCDGQPCDDGCEGEGCCEGRDCDAEAQGVMIEIDQVPKKLEMYMAK